VLSLAIIGGTGAFAYRSFSTPARVTDPPVIKADGTPAKVPAAPQSGEKQIYDRVGERSQGERVVSREEQPVDLREPSRGPANMVVTTGSTGTTAPSAAISPPAAPSGTEPKKVKTLVIRPDQTSAPTPAPIRTAPVRTTGSAPTRTASLPAAGDAGYLVQLASQKTEADAQASYRALQGRFPTQLGSRPAVIRRVDLGEKGTFFRALVGPFGSADQATDFCGSLKTAGGQCVVQKN
jgi:cell division septation protein DedD